MTATVHTLVIPSKRQDALAYEMNLQRLSRQHQQAAWRKEILEIIEGAEAAIMHQEQVIFYGRQLLSQIDGGPTDAA